PAWLGHQNTAGRRHPPVRRPANHERIMSEGPIAGWPRVVVETAFYAVSIFFFVYLFYYFWTSDGGPTLLAMTLVPVAYVLFILNSLRDDDLYPSLPASANYIIAAVYIALAAIVAFYMH